MAKSNVEKFHEMAADAVPAQEKVNWNAAEVAAYGDDYYRDPAKYEEHMAMLRLQSLPASDPRRLEALANGNPGISADASYTTLFSDMAGDSEFVNTLRQYEQSVIQAAQQAEVARDAELKAQSDQMAAERDQAATENTWDDWAPISFVRGMVRTGLSAFEAPFQIGMNAWRTYGGHITGQGADEDPLYEFGNIFYGTDIAQIANGQQTGDSWWGVDADSEAGKMLDFIHKQQWTDPTTGKAMGIGPAAVQAAFFDVDRDSTAYGITSGLVDAFYRILDPGMYVGTGEAKALGGVVKGAITGGKDGAALARAGSGTRAIGKGVAEARGVVEETVADANRAKAAIVAADERAAVALAAKNKVLTVQSRLDSAVNSRNLLSKSSDELMTEANSVRRSAVDTEVNGVADIVTRRQKLQEGLDAAQAKFDEIERLKKAIDVAKKKDLPRLATELRLATNGMTSSATTKLIKIITKNREELAKLDALDPNSPFFVLAKKGDPAEAIVARHKETLLTISQTDNAVTALRKQLEEYTAQATKLEDEALAAKAQAKALSESLPARAGEYDLDTLDGLAAYVSDASGIIKYPSGSRGLDIDMALNSVFRGALQPVLRAFSKINDPAIIMEFTRGKIADPDILKALARAETPEQVKTVLMEALGKGQLNHTVGKLNMLRSFSRTVGKEGVPYYKAVGDFGQAFGYAPRIIRWSNNATQRRVPWAHDMHIEDAPAMIRGTMDMAAFVTKSWKRADRDEFSRKWVNRMINASTGVERKAVGLDMIKELSERALKDSGFNDAEVQLFQKTFGVTKKELLYSNSYDEMDNIIVNTQAFKQGGYDSNMGIMENRMNEHFWFPDPKKIKRLVADADAIRKRGGEPNMALHAYNTLFDDYWRTGILLKPSFIIRNNIEMQGRMFMNRHPSMFTNPGAIFAIAFEKYGKMRGFSKSWNVADIDATGKIFTRNEAADESLYTIMAEFSDDLSARTSLVDIGSNQNWRELGYEGIAALGDDGYWKGVSSALLTMNSNPLARAVLSVASGRPNKDVLEWMSTKGLTDREALLDMVVNGPYRTVAERTIDNASRKIDVDWTDLTSVNKLIFDERSGYSIYSKWKDFTHGFNDELVRTLDEPQYSKVDIGDPISGDASSYHLQVNSLETKVQVALGKAATDGSYAVKTIGIPNFTAASTKIDTNWFRTGTNWFFKNAGTFEKAFSTSPELRYSYWDTIHSLMSGMSPAEAQKVLAIAERSLGKNVAGIPTSGWGARVLQNIRSEAKKASGSLSANDVHRMGVRQAGVKAEELFYIAGRRNAFAHQMRLIMPFAQAWGNSMKVYGGLVTKNSQMVYRASQLWDAANSKESNVVYGLLSGIPGDPLGVSGYDPNQGFIYRDPLSGKSSVMLPGASTVLGTIAGLSTGQAPLEMNASTSVESMNMIFQSGWGPGFGPVFQSLANGISATTAYRQLPTFLKVFDIPGLNTQLTQFQNPNDPNQGMVTQFLEGMTPGAVKGLAAYLGIDFLGVAEKYRQPAAAYLFSSDPTKYLDSTGKIGPDQAKLLEDDATKLAKGMALGQGLVKFVAPGSIVPQMYSMGDDGTSVAQYVIAREYTDLTSQNGGDQGIAWQTMIDKYGINVLMSLVPSRADASAPSDKTWNFIQDNKDIVDNVSSEILELLFVGGAYSVQFDLFQRRYGLGTRLTPLEQTEYADRLLKAGRKDQLAKAYATGKMTKEQYDAAVEQLNADFADAEMPEFEAGKQARRVQEMRDAITDPRIANLPSAQAAARYFALYDQGRAIMKERGYKSFDAAGMKDVRQWLWDSGRQILVENKDFYDTWTFLFSSEVKP